MEHFLNILLLVVGFISFIPVINLFNTSEEMKYRCLKFLMNATFMWTLLIFAEQFSTNVNIVYYAHMLGYPLKFLMAIFMMCTIYNYVEKKFPKWQIIGLGIVFVVEYLLAITNARTQFILELVPGDVVSFESLYDASTGPLFIYHLAAVYLLLVISIVYLAIFLTKHKEVRHYKIVSRTMTYSVIIVLFFNALQLLAVK